MIDTQAIRLRWELDGSRRDERGKRLFAASEARAAGWGGVAAVAEITGLARSRIVRGLKDLDAAPLEPGRVRRKGGGRRAITDTDPTRRWPSSTSAATRSIQNGTTRSTPPATRKIGAAIFAGLLRIG
jgi:hypothetical protein